MPIKVNISLSTGGRLKPVSSHTFHDKRITVGRDKECTLTLEDTQKHVSRTHAEVLEEDGRYWMKVVSKVNPVLCNGKRYAYGDKVALNQGDHITVGLYRLDIGEATVAPPPKPEAPKPAAEKPEDITYVARRADFLPPSGVSVVPPAPTQKAQPPAPPPPPPQPVAPTQPAVVAEARIPPSPPPVVPEIPSDEATYIPPSKGAPVAVPPPKPAAPQIMLPDSTVDEEVTYIPPMSARPKPANASAPAAIPAPREDDTFSEDLTSIRRPLVDTVKPPAAAPAAAPSAEPAEALDFDLSDAFAESAAPAPAPAPAAPPPEEVEEDFSEDLTYVGRPLPKRPITAPPPPPPVDKAQPPVSNPVPIAAQAEASMPNLSEEATFVRPVVPPSAPVAPAPMAKASSGGTAAGEQAVQAFLEGAGLAHLKVPDAEAFMRESGVMVRAAIEGLMMLLIAREKMRTDLGAPPDPSAGDNPLKSMADPAEVIQFLFDPRRPAIANADPVQAFSDACSELRAHQVALYEAMQAAVKSALKSVDPKRIEREHGVNVGGLNLTRKSKLWDVAVAAHEKLMHEAEEDFSKAFGREILAAYSDQLHKIRGGR